MTAYMKIGAAYNLGTAMMAMYPDGGFEPGEASLTQVGGAYGIWHYIRAFTNTSGLYRTVREVGMGYDNSTACDLHPRLLLDINAIPNFCIVPPNAVITVDYYFNYIDPDHPSVVVILDTSTFTNASPIHFNAVKLPNAVITSISPLYGGKTWEFRCYTETQSDIDALQMYVCPMEVGVSITGQQYVKSPIPAGTLFIKDLGTRIKIPYANCFIQSIDIEPMYLSSGLIGQWFNVTIVQSAYADA